MSQVITLSESTLGNRPHLQLVATILVAIAYGFIICLFFHTLSLLITNGRRTYTRTMRTLLIIYIIVMFGLSTASAIQQFIYITGSASTAASILATSSSFNVIKMNEPLFLPLTIFGADGFMLWRSVILYQRASLRHRLLLYVVLSCISMGTFVSATLYYAAPRIPVFALKSPFTPSIVTISITTSLNFILTSIIVGRLIYHQDTMRRILGKGYGSPYMRIVVMLLESCSLILVTGIVFLILISQSDMKRPNGYIIPLLLLPHVCVVSPLLIVYHVAKGRAITKSTARLSQVAIPNVEGMMEEGVPNLRSIEFHRYASSTFNQEHTSAPDVSQSQFDRHAKPDDRQPLEVQNESLPIPPV